MNSRACHPRPIELAARDDYSCALLPDGSAKCWGDNIYGVLGRGNTIDVDNPASVGPMSITDAPGVRVTELAAGWYHACALLSDLSVKCWGYGKYAELGYGNTETIGDDELPSSIGPVSITTSPGITVKSLAAGFLHGCALLSDGSVKCWGSGSGLGYGNTNAIGDDELPSSVGPISVTTTPGVTVKEVTAGEAFTCALLSDESVKCWGDNRFGALGTGNTANIGDDELPSSIGPVSVTATPGITVEHLAAGFEHVCALLSDGSLRCWGQNDFGQLGYGNTANVGDDEVPSSVGPVDVSAAPGVSVTAVAAGGHHTCAVLSNGTVECWGLNRYGQLGYGNTENVGDDEAPSSAGAVSVTTARGITVQGLALGGNHTCAVLSDDSVQCWGNGGQGQLGHGNTENVGDDELPSSVAAVEVF